jgi:hypothetical protein
MKGASGDGDILNPINLKYCYDKYNQSMDIITGDGGFDYSIDFNKQELLSVKLILAQIFYAIIMQNKNGTFIIKFFDIFYKPTCDMIYFFSFLPLILISYLFLFSSFLSIIYPILFF